MRAIVAILVAHMNRAEVERTLLKPAATWQAYDYYLRGAEAYFLHMRGRTTTSDQEARRLLEQSLAIDPEYARAYAMLSRSQVYAYIEPSDDDYMRPAALERAHELAETAVHLDARLPQARAELGWVLLWKRKYGAAIAEFERAFALNPNFIEDRFGQALTYAGEPAKAIEVLVASTRLDPFQPPRSLLFIGHALYMLKRYDEAARLLRECTLRMPNSNSLIFTWRPYVPSWESLSRRGRKPRRSSGSTQDSVLQGGSALPSTKILGSL